MAFCSLFLLGRRYRCYAARAEGPAPRGRKYRGIPPANATPNRGYSGSRAEVAELVDAPDSKSGAFTGVWVRVPPSALAGRKSGGSLAGGGAPPPGKPAGGG